MSYIGAQPQTAEFYYDVFNGNGVTTTFTTTISPGTPVSVIVIVNDSILDPEDYYFDGNQIVFLTAPGAGTRNIQLRYLAVPVSGQAAPMTYRNVNEYYATVGQTIFQTSYYDLGWIDVYVNGTQLGNDDFQALDGLTVVLQNPCNNQDLVRIVSAYTTVLARATDPQMPFAYSKANTASANTIYTQGVDTTQNTNITTAQNKAQAAFDYANTIIGSGNSIDQAARNTANSASSNTIYTQGVDVTQNTRISVIEGVDLAQNANITTVQTKAQAAFDYANTISGSGTSIDQFARNTANNKLDSAGGIISGSLVVGSNLTVLGNSTVISTSTLEVGDSLIYLAKNNYTSDAVDIGIIGHYNDGTNAHAGIIRDPVLKEWIFFKGYTPEVSSNNLITIAEPSFAHANVYAGYFKGNLITRGVDIYSYAQAAFSVANTAAAGSIDQFARNTANAEVSLQSGINSTQNTNITAADTKAQAAFASANIINGVTATQNTRMSIIEGVDVGQNTRITTADTKAQAAFDYANTIIGSGNSIDTYARTTANASVTLQSGINSTQNSWITAADTKAQAAFTAANTKVASITGTSNQVIVSGTTSATLSLPQSIATSSSVQFGSFGVGTAASGTSGEIRATNNITAYYSDDRLKTRLGTIEDALEKVKSLTGFYYEANQTAQDLGYAVKREVGLSAQDTQKVLPEIVVPAPIDEKYLTIHYEKVIPLLVEAIKDLSKEIDDLKSR